MRGNGVASGKAANTDNVSQWGEAPTSLSKGKESNRVQQKSDVKVAKDLPSKSRGPVQARLAVQATHSADLSSVASGSASSSASFSSSEDHEDFRSHLRDHSHVHSHENSHHGLVLEANEAFGWQQTLGDDVLDHLATVAPSTSVTSIAPHHPLLTNTYPNTLNSSNTSGVGLSNGAQVESHVHSRGIHSGSGKGRVTKEGLKREAKMKKERARRAKLHDRFVELAEALGLTEEARIDRLTLLTESLRSVRSMQDELVRLRANVQTRTSSQHHTTSTPASGGSHSMANISSGHGTCDHPSKGEGSSKPNGAIPSPAEFSSSDASSSPLTVPQPRRVRPNAGSHPGVNIGHAAGLSQPTTGNTIPNPTGNMGNGQTTNGSFANMKCSGPGPGPGPGPAGPMNFNGPMPNMGMPLGMAAQMGMPMSMSMPISVAMQMGLHNIPPSWWSSYHSGAHGVHQMDSHFLSAPQGSGITYPGSAAAVAASNWSRWFNGHSPSFHPSQMHFPHHPHGASMPNMPSNGVDYSHDSHDHTYAISSHDEDVHILDSIHDPIHEHFYNNSHDHSQLQDHDGAQSDVIPTPYM